MEETNAAMAGGHCYGFSVTTQLFYLEDDPRNYPHLLVTDEQGRRLGYVNGRLVDEIPGARVVRPLLDFAVEVEVWAENEEPEFRVPAGLNLTITIDGTGLKRPSTSSFAMIGPGHDVVIDDIRLEPGQKDTLKIHADESAFTYTTAPHQSESPVLRMGVQGKHVDHAFWVKWTHHGEGIPLVTRIGGVERRIILAD